MAAGLTAPEQTVAEAMPDTPPAPATAAAENTAAQNPTTSTEQGV